MTFREQATTTPRTMDGVAKMLEAREEVLALFRRERVSAERLSRGSLAREVVVVVFGVCDLLSLEGQ